MGRITSERIIRYTCLIFIALNMFVLPSNIAVGAYFVLFSCFAILILTGQFRINLKVFFISIVLIFILLSYITKYKYTYVILSWFSLFFMTYYSKKVGDKEVENSKDLIEDFLWIFLLVAFFINIFVVGYQIDGDMVFPHAYPDKNYTAVSVFMLFMYGIKRGYRTSIIPLMMMLLFYSNSRSLLLMSIIFVATIPLKRFIPEVKKKNIYFVIFLLQIFLIVPFSYFWINNVSTYNMTAYRESLNDYSNKVRFSANVFAWEEILMNSDHIIAGYGDSLKSVMGIEETENVFYNGAKLVQTHNSVLSVLVINGWIPGLIYLWALGKVLTKYGNKKNYEYVLPVLINSFVLPMYAGGMLVFWLFILIIPKRKLYDYRITKWKIIRIKRLERSELLESNYEETKKRE